MTQSPNPMADDTSDRLYTPEELSAFAAGEDAAAAQEADDALGAPPPAPVAPPAPVRSKWETGPPPAAPQPGAAHRNAPSGPTSGPPAGPYTAPPTGHAQVTEPPRRAAPPAPPAPPVGPPPSRASGTHSGAPQAAPSAPPSGGVPAVAAPSGPPAVMSATDFLDRRDSSRQSGPATWGWQGTVRRWSGGLIKPRMSEAEQLWEADRATIQRDFDGPRTIAFINPKGGAAKTTGVLATGYTFGTVRGGGVVAWDNNETRGTLGIRGTRSAHSNTTRELLNDLGRFNDVTQSRLGDLSSFVRSQGDAHFDVLASDERPDVTGQIHAEDFNAIHKLMERFYRVILVDTGNNMRAENWLAAADAADLLVVTSTVREDTGYSGLWMLDALQDAGYQNLKYKAITVLSDPSPNVDQSLANDLVEVYQQRTRAVYRVPYDPILVAGGVMAYNQLSLATRRSWEKAVAGMAEAL